MSLVGLSNELLNAIIEFSEFSGVRELCKTCHLLNTLATPYLYSTIIFNDESEDVSSKDPAHYLFLRTIVNRPDLAKLPKTFQCPDNIYDPAPSAWDLIRIKVNEASANKGQAKLWRIAICGLGYSRAPGSDGVFAFIVCLLPNLKEIHMSEGRFNRHVNADSVDPTAEFFAPLFAHAVALQTKQRASENEISPYSMSKLTFMSIKTNLSEDVPLSKIVHRLELPSIKKFVVQNAFDFYPNNSFRIPETFTSQVEDLRFERSEIHPENMRRLLSSCPSLRRFALKHSSSMDVVPFCSTSVIEGLMASKKTLEFIEARAQSEYNFVHIGFFGRPGSFADFPNLREIVMSAGIILDHSKSRHAFAELDSVDDMDDGNNAENKNCTVTDYTRAFLQRIPRSLQSLTLKDCYALNHMAIEAVIALVREKERYAPDLKYISLTWSMCLPRPDELRKSGLVEACKEEGIGLELPQFKLGN